jgi:hypothetical protein
MTAGLSVRHQFLQVGGMPHQRLTIRACLTTPAANLACRFIAVRRERRYQTLRGERRKSQFQLDQPANNIFVKTIARSTENMRKQHSVKPINNQHS